MEDGTEIDNSFYSNLGILARGAVANVQNPRKVPGILAAPYPDFRQPQEDLRTHSDIDHPSVFWITNAYNDFAYNMAAGAGTCGACYWLVPTSISGMSTSQTWEGYAAMQVDADHASTTPFKRFEGNYCTTAMNSFQTVSNTAVCFGVVNTDPGAQSPQLTPLPTPNPIGDPNSYYPNIVPGGGHFPTLCGPNENCAQLRKCASGNTGHCAVTVINRYTTSFNWADTNFAAMWLRPQWYLVLNSVISDVQNGGLTFITGGGYSKSDVVDGHWSLAKKTAFIGQTQDPTINPYASNAGPVNPRTPLRCGTQPTGAAVGNFCLLADEGISFQMDGFGINQRLFNIYDGPAYQESNAYLNIPATHLEDCSPQSDPTVCNQSGYLSAHMMSVPKAADNSCYLPNAAIGWKQPNGFYYPPAFHSSNLYFDNVDIRHYLIEPLFADGTLYQTDQAAAKNRYCTWNPAMFNGFTDIDRQTELNDDDGSLTGLVNTVSVNHDPYFHGPVSTPECASDIASNVPPGTATTSAYDYVTTAIIPGCGYNCINWSQDCTTQFCYGVPLYRQYILSTESAAPKIRMGGQATAQRSTLTVNHGLYYIDTTVSAADQQRAGASSTNEFQAGQTYYTMLLFTKPTTQQTYQLYVGPGFDPSTGVFMARGDLGTVPVQFSKGAWPSTWPAPVYDLATGLLTVTIDMSFSQFQLDYQAAQQSNCAPVSFCSFKPATSTCSSALDPTDDLYQDSTEICGKWTAKDVDCPDGGCYAFGVTLPAGFATGPQANLPPPPVPFPSTNDWTQPFIIAPADVAGPQCTYSTPPVGSPSPFPPRRPRWPRRPTLQP